jgi:hypothetical protein
VRLSALTASRTLRTASLEFDILFPPGALFYGIWYASAAIVKPHDLVETLKTRAT